MSVKDELMDRYTKLTAQRAAVAKRQAAELATMDQQLTTLKMVISKWDTLTIDQALAAANGAGVRIVVDA